MKKYFSILIAINTLIVIFCAPLRSFLCDGKKHLLVFFLKMGKLWRAGNSQGVFWVACTRDPCKACQVPLVLAFADGQNVYLHAVFCCLSLPSYEIVKYFGCII